MKAETQRKVELLKEKGLTIKEIKEILNLTNHDLYPENKEDPKSETAQEEEPMKKKSTVESSEAFQSIKISSNRAVNDFTKQQELCLLKLIERIDKPFKDQWEWAAWKREAVALQLEQHTTNSFFLDSKTMWGKLIEGATTRKYREITVFLIHNHLEKTFAQARGELAYREREQGGMD